MSGAPDKAGHALSPPEQWVDLYGDYLFRYAMGRLRDADVAEDLVQETLIGALKARERFGGKSSERTWLTGILKHKILDYYRTRYRERPISDLDTADEGAEALFDRHEWWREGMGTWEADPATLARDGEFWGVLHKCLDGVPGRNAEAFRLRVLEDMTTEEVCNILNVTPTNLNVMLHRARLRLRHCLEENWFEA